METGETYRKLSEENIRLQAEVLQYKVVINFIIVFFSLTCFGDAKHAEVTLLPWKQAHIWSSGIKQGLDSAK